MADTNPKKPKKAAPKPEIEASEGIPAQPETEQAAPPKKKTGRPSKYDPDIAQQICEQLSDGIPLREICRQEGYPSYRAVYRWMVADEELSSLIARAREIGYDLLAEECLYIADNPKTGKRTTFTSGAEEGEDSMTVVEEDMLGHRKLQIETRLKLLAKWNPKKYGDKVQVGGDAENPLTVTADVSLFDALLSNIEAKRQVSNAE